MMAVVALQSVVWIWLGLSVAVSVPMGHLLFRSDGGRHKTPRTDGVDPASLAELLEPEVPPAAASGATP